jgi:hypothetical protein
MSQQSVRQAARRSALDAQAVLRKERADRERRLEGLAVAVLTALGEPDALVRDAERRAGQALRTMTEEEGLSVRGAVDWCGSGVSVREVTRLLRPDGSHQGGRDEHVECGWPCREGAPYLGSLLADRQHGMPALGIPRVRGFSTGLCGSCGLSSFSGSITQRRFH